MDEKTYWLKGGRIVVDSAGKWIKCSSCPCSIVSNCAVVKSVSYTSTNQEVCGKTIAVYSYEISLKKVDLPYTPEPEETFVAGVDGTPDYTCDGSYSETINYKTYAGSAFDLQQIYHPKGGEPQITDEHTGLTSVSGDPLPERRIELENPTTCHKGFHIEDYVLLKASEGCSEVTVEFTLENEQTLEVYTETATVGEDPMSPLSCGQQPQDMVISARVINCKSTETEHRVTLSVGESLSFTGTLISQ